MSLLSEHRLLGRVIQRGETATATVETRNDHHDSADLVQRRERIQNTVRRYIQLTFDELGVAGSAETQKLRSALDGIELEEKDIAGWEESMDWYEERAPASARQLISEFHDQLRSARLEKIIGLRGAEEWVRTFHDPNKSYKQREHLVQNAFKRWQEKAKETKNQRNKLAVLPRVKELPSSKVPRIKDFLDPDAFADMKIGAQKSLIAQIQAALRSKSIEKDTVYDDAHDLLKAARSAGYLHPNKVGRWLKRTMNHANPETYVATTLPYLLENWKAIRADYDDIAPHIIRHRPALLLKAANASTFLSWSYPQCTTYLAEARSQLAEAEKVLEADRKLQSTKLIVRHYLMTEDWIGAEEALQGAFAIAPKDPDVQSMQNYLDAHRADVEEETAQQNERPAEDVKKETDEMIAQVPIGARDMVRTCAEAGSKATGTLGAAFFNRVWAKEKGYSDEAQEMRDANDKTIHEETKSRMPTGHTNEREKGVIAGSTESSLAINDKPKNAQILHTRAGSNAQQTIANAAIRNADNGDFMYWTSVIPDVPYGQHEYMVRNVFPKLKNNLRTLEGKGTKYSYGGQLLEKDSEEDTSQAEPPDVLQLPTPAPQQAIPLKKAG